MLGFAAKEDYSLTDRAAEIHVQIQFVLKLNW